MPLPFNPPTTHPLDKRDEKRKAKSKTMKFAVTVTALCAASATAHQSFAQPYLFALRTAGLIPTTFPPFTPSSFPSILYPPSTNTSSSSPGTQGGQGLEVQLGNPLTLAQTAPQPRVKIPIEYDYQGTYVLAMIDPDAPTPANPTRAPIRHWLVSNLTSSALYQNITDNRTSGGVVLSTYAPPGPPAGSPPHRYCFALYRRPFLDIALPAFNVTDRTLFDLSRFATQGGLTLVGVNYFTAQRMNATQ